MRMRTDKYCWFCSLVQMLHSESKKVTNGILDMKWYNELLYLERTAFNSVNYNNYYSYRNAQAILALALSSGEVTFLQLNTESVCM